MKIQNVIFQRSTFKIFIAVLVCFIGVYFYLQYASLPMNFFSFFSTSRHSSSREQSRNDALRPTLTSTDQEETSQGIGDVVTLVPGVPVTVKELTLTVDGFNHKFPQGEHDIHEWVEISVTKQKEAGYKEEVTLMSSDFLDEHGEKKSILAKKTVGGYTFELLDLQYNQSATVRVSKAQ
jgi:hypothetical protein